MSEPLRPIGYKEPEKPTTKTTVRVVPRWNATSRFDLQRRRWWWPFWSTVKTFDSSEEAIAEAKRLLAAPLFEA